MSGGECRLSGRWLLPALIGGLLLSAATQGQLVEEYNPPRANCCLATAAKTLADQLQDWNQLGRYHAENEALKKQQADPKRVVFMGDSITDGWRLGDSFPGKPYVNRGISGQVTAQMLVRTYPDVINLQPAALIILAGTNDVARNNGPQTITMIEQNLMAMTELAQKHGIKVVLCSVLPVSDYTFQGVGRGGGQPPPGTAAARGPARIQTVQRPPADILKLNAWMKTYAASVNAVYADYFPALADSNGMLKDGFSNDGLHPNEKGYALMAPIAQAAIDKALQ